MIICQCTGVTDRQIARMIEEGATTVGDIARRCGAGRCCAPCRVEIAEMIAEASPRAQSCGLPTVSAAPAPIPAAP